MNTLVGESSLVLVDGLLPVCLGVLATISNVRNHVSRAGEGTFWTLIGINLSFLSLLFFWFVDMVIHPQPEGLAAFSLVVIFPFLALPGSIIPVGLNFVLPGGGNSLFLDTGPDIWMMAGAVAWQFFIANGIRWLAYSRRRGAHRAPRLEA